MFIQKVIVKNLRLFKDGFTLDETNIAVPNGINEGSGLTIIVGENGVGKSTILDAISYSLISYKADSLSLNDFSDIKNEIDVTIESDEEFTVKRTMSGQFQANGFSFVAKVRSQNSTKYPVGTIVTDTFFTPSVEGTVKDGSPDLRVAVNNPFAGPRFSDNDYVFIDKNRIKALESGTYSTTRFDRLLDNFNFQYLKANNKTPLELHDVLDSTINAGEEHISNELLEEAFTYFEKVTGYKVQLNLIDNLLPYKKAFLGFEDMNQSQIPIERIGSGYQMFLALICQHKLSLQSGKKLVMLIDEVELNLHPRLQRTLVELLLQISKDSQIILTSHSPELLKDLRKNKYHKVNAVVKNDAGISINPINEFVLPSPTVSETNYVAFGLASMEYFIELYNQFAESKNVDSIAAIDRALGVPDDEMIQWEREDASIQKLSVYSCIRNKFFHPNNKKNDSKFKMDYAAVEEAIKFLREKLITP